MDEKETFDTDVCVKGLLVITKRIEDPFIVEYFLVGKLDVFRFS